jgi:RHS repeat-associated protein
VSRYGYDKAGRLTFSQDTWYGTRRFKYNLAGELTETVNGVGGRTRFEYDVRGRLIRITDPMGGVTTRTYTATDQVKSVTDPLGRVTTATYDPAGRQLSQTDPDGHTTTWTYDQAGRESSTSFDGKLLAGIERDPARRSVVITDHTAGDGLAVEHELGFDRRGLLTSRTRGNKGLSWAYDADGHRTAFTDANGTTTTYRRDAAGRVTAASNPQLGEAVFAYDASGRITAATAGDLVQEWTYRNGALAEHTRTDTTNPAAADVTLIGRDQDGRITGLTRSGAVTRYGYDGAGQMVSAATTRTRGLDSSAPASVSGWVYDTGGRLVRESTPGGSRAFEYDAGGQLHAVTDTDGSRTEYVHDGLGRRTRLIRPDGSWTEYAWGPTGHLSGTSDRTPDGAAVSRHGLWVDALGELAAVDGAELWWDTANPIPALAGISGGQVLSLPGGVTGIGDAWTVPGWRAARPTDDTDPWAVIGTTTVPDPSPGITASAGAGRGAVLPAGVTLTGNGGVDIAGLEWLGARAYDPASRGFLSTDPLAPVLGAGWDGNPYSYAGNNPLNASDPTGLRPLTDDELKAYDQSAGSHWEYVVAGLAVAGGVAALFVPGLNLIAAGAIAGALTSGGLTAYSQKAQNGSVDWWSVLGNTAVGAATGAAGGGAAMWTRTILAGAPAGQAAAALGVSGGANGVLGAGASGASYMVQNGGQINNGWDFAGKVAGGGFAGAVGGLAGPAGGTLARGMSFSASGLGAKVGTAAISGVGAGVGSMLENMVSGDPVDPAKAGITGLFGAGASGISSGIAAGASALPPGRIPVLSQHGVDTLKQMPYFAPRTMSGMFNPQQTNTAGLWNGGTAGAAVGFGGDLFQGRLGW